MTAVQPPADSALAPGFAGADLVDAYAVGLPPAATRDIGEIARCVLAGPPPWLRALLAVRDVAVAGLGVKTRRQIVAGADREHAERLGFFRVQARSDRELVVGEDDRHLDFRTSVLLRAAAGGGEEVVATTVVRCRNRVGRVYLAAISPFHRVVVRALLRRAAARGWT